MIKNYLKKSSPGDDTFVSKYSYNSNNFYSPTGDDILYGYAGDDTFQPYKGDDYIDGGEGFDTVIIPGLKSNYITSYDDSSATATLSSSYYGEKRIKNVENIEFKPSSISDNTNPYTFEELFPDVNNTNSSNDSNTDNTQNKPIGYNLTNEDGVTFTLKNGSQLNYSPPGEPLQFANAPTGVIFDSAYSQWNHAVY